VQNKARKPKQFNDGVLAAASSSREASDARSDVRAKQSQKIQGFQLTHVGRLARAATLPVFRRHNRT
jgi:hypothetical protein